MKRRKTNMAIHKYLDGKGPLMVNIDAAIAAKTAIFGDGEHGTIRHIFWCGATNAHKVSLVNDDGAPIFKFTAATGDLSPHFENIDLNFGNGLYCDDLDGGDFWLVLSAIMPSPKDLKV